MKMSEQIEIFIENVRKYRFLFDSSHEHFKNVFKKNEAWNEIAQELNMTSEEAKAKWKNLRDSYMRFKKAMKGDTGQARKYSKWPWSSHMSFLDAYTTIQYRPRSSNISQAAREFEDDSLSQEPTSPLVNYNDASNQLHPLIEILPSPPPKKKTKSDIDKVFNFLQSIKSSEKHIDAVDHLFLSYAATFKTFRPRTQSILKLKLATIFSETELNELQAQDESQKT